MKENDEKKYTGHRRGGPGGEGCRLSVLPITAKRPDGMQFDAQLLDAGSESTEVELLRTIAEKMGIRWGHDDIGWWAVAPGSGFPTWSVRRQDDIGNTFLVKANLAKKKRKPWSPRWRPEVIGRHTGAATI